jgi:sigma-B regulation protein RsbU (phosphoserine phosphatase)
VIGLVADLKYPSARIELPRPAELYIFSDGVYEIARPDGSWQSLSEFTNYLRDVRPSIDELLNRMREIHGVTEFEDDFSLLRLKLS